MVIIKFLFDDDAVLKCEEYGFNKNNIRKAVLNNLFNENSAIYYLVIRRKIIEGKESMSDLFLLNLLNLHLMKIILF